MDIVVPIAGVVTTSANAAGVKPWMWTSFLKYYSMPTKHDIIAANSGNKVWRLNVQLCRSITRGINVVDAGVQNLSSSSTFFLTGGCLTFQSLCDWLDDVLTDINACLH